MTDYHNRDLYAEQIIQADVYNAAPPRPDHRAHGLRALEDGDYDTAVRHLEAAVVDHPDDQVLHYYRALALLGGYRPNQHSADALRKVLARLERAGNLPEARALRTLVNEDYGLSWHKWDVVTPELRALIGEVTVARCREITRHVPAREARTWRELNRRAR